LLLIASAIAVVNAVLNTAIARMTACEKQMSLSAQEQAITLKLLLGLIINTSMRLTRSYLFPNESYAGITVILVTRDFGVLGLGSIFHGSYRDFTSRWYGNMGPSELFAMTINVISPHSGLQFNISDRYASMLNTVFITLSFRMKSPYCCRPLQ
jgi:hypothetical protein